MMIRQEPGKEQERDQPEEEPRWPTLSGKTIDMNKLLQWGLQHSTKNEDAPSAASRPVEPLDPKWVDIILGKSDVVRMKGTEISLKVEIKLCYRKYHSK
jgi:hypothetical protein